MDVTMHTIKAGPDGCADAGATISLSDAEAKRLIKGKFAVEATRPVRETAMIDPAGQERAEREQAKARAEAEAAKEAVRKSAASVGQALESIDPTDDEDWTAAGKPAMDRVKELTGSTTLTRAELEALYPDFARPVAVSATGAPAEAAKATSEPAPAGSSAARSNRP